MSEEVRERRSKLPKEAYDDCNLYLAIQKYKSVLAEDPECCVRFNRATQGAKEWLCYSRWCRETEGIAGEYQKSLLSWMMPTEIAYVLQFETNPRLIESLKAGMLVAMDRITAPERVRAVEKESIADHRRLVEKYKGARQMFEGWTFYANLGRVMFLEGCDEGAARCFHPDHGLYCAWWSRWARVATFKKELESGAMRY